MHIQTILRICCILSARVCFTRIYKLTSRQLFAIFYSFLFFVATKSNVIYSYNKGFEIWFAWVSFTTLLFQIYTKPKHPNIFGVHWKENFHIRVWVYTIRFMLSPFFSSSKCISCDRYFTNFFPTATDWDYEEKFVRSTYLWIWEHNMKQLSCCNMSLNLSNHGFKFYYVILVL